MNYSIVLGDANNDKHLNFARSISSNTFPIIFCVEDKEYIKEGKPDIIYSLYKSMRKDHPVDVFILRPLNMEELIHLSLSARKRIFLNQYSFDLNPLSWIQTKKGFRTHLLNFTKSDDLEILAKMRSREICVNKRFMSIKDGVMNEIPHVEKILKEGETYTVPENTDLIMFTNY